MTLLQRLIKDDRGATAIEYGLIAALICIAIIGAAQNTSTATTAAWTKVADATAKATANN
jgi:pilus assembly protein Flp/PilA